MGEQRVLGSCSNCLLTPSAEQLLTRLEADLRASRGDDETWTADACPACGRTTVIRDEREGWSFGDTGWSFEPDAEGPRDAEAPSAAETSSASRSPGSEPDLAPAWLTLSEFAYCTGTSVEDVVAQLEAGRLDHVSLLGEDPLGVLVRAPDAEPRRDTGATPRARRPRRRRRSDGLGGTTLVLVAALGLLFAGALWWTTRAPSPARTAEATTSGMTLVAPEPASGADGSAPSRPDPGPATVRSEQDGATDAPTADGSPAAAAPTSSVPAATGADLTVGPVEFVTHGGTVSAVTHIRNTSGRWLPPSEVTFLVLDTSGATIGTGHGTVDLAPGEEAVVVADRIQLGPEPPTIGSVGAELDAAPLRAPAQMGGSLFVDRASIEGSTVRGALVNTGPARDVVRVDCALSAGGRLSGVTVVLVQPVAANGSTTFAATITDATGPLDAVECSAT